MTGTRRVREITPHLRTLFTGNPDVVKESPSASPVLYAGTPDHLSMLAAAYGSGAVYFGPSHVIADGLDIGVPVIDIDGDIGEMDDIYVGALLDDGPTSVRVQDYSSGPYVSILGSTTVRITSDDDLATFFDDADAAVEDGVFHEFLTNPAVALADLSALGFRSRSGQDGPSTRLVVSDEGKVSVSPHGMPLASLDEEFVPDAAEVSWRREGVDPSAGSAVPLAGVVSETARSRGVSDRPWIARYLLAVEAVRRLRAHSIDDIKISGFGHRLQPSVPDRDREDWTLPILAFTREQAFIVEESRATKVSLEAAALLEPVIAAGGLADRAEAADESTARLLTALAAQGVSFVSEARAADR